MLVQLGLVEYLPEAITTRREPYQCPHCTSLIQIKGVPDATVGGLQDLYCPVCQQMWWISSWRLEKRLWPLPITFPTTYKWYVEKVLKRGPEQLIALPPIPIDRPAPGGGWPEIKEQGLNLKKIAFYGFLILAGVIVVNQVAKQVTKKYLH